MNNIKLFEEFSSEKLFENRVDAIKIKAGINEFEWNAMRANPEIVVSYKKHIKYYNSDTTKDFVKKIVSAVCDIFGDGKNMKSFLISLAAAESCYGTNPGTYARPGVTKGIFQLDKNSALKTIGYSGFPIDGNEEIKKNLEKLRLKLKNALGLDWSQIPYSSLAKPLYNAIACRMYIEVKLRDYNFNKATNSITTVYKAIPPDLAGQAKWWKNRYNTAAGAGTEAHFKNPPGCNFK